MIIFAFQLARSSFQKPNLPVGRKKTSDDRFCSSVCAIAKEKKRKRPWIKSAFASPGLFDVASVPKTHTTHVCQPTNAELDL